MLVSCTSTKRATINTPLKADLLPATDVVLISGNSCGYQGGVRYFVKNENKNARVIANVVANSLSGGFEYLNSSGAKGRYVYPTPARGYLLLPGEAKSVGCTKWRVGADATVIDQSFVIEGAYYPSDDATFPELESPIDYPIFVTERNDVCSPVSKKRMDVRVYNSHPFKRLEVVTSSNHGRADDSTHILDPQGKGDVTGCEKIGDKFQGWHITSARFVP